MIMLVTKGKNCSADLTNWISLAQQQQPDLKYIRSYLSFVFFVLKTSILVLLRHQKSLCHMISFHFVLTFVPSEQVIKKLVFLSKRLTRIS